MKCNIRNVSQKEGMGSLNASLVRALPFLFKPIFGIVWLVSELLLPSMAVFVLGSHPLTTV